MQRILLTGESIGDRFEVEHHVARGGMGTVYRAQDRLEGQPVALKLIEIPADDPEGLSRFEREASLLGRVTHPRIVRYVGRGRLDDRHVYLAMQWLEGEDLRAALARGPLSTEEARSVLECIAEALSAVHAEGVVHRDVKPGNLFLRNGSTSDVVLLDFGIARPMEVTKRLTATGALIGTPQYMAPEQLVEGGRIRPATDIFSAGCIFYECLTGKPAFEAAHVVGVIARILYDDPMPLRSIHPDVPPAWDDLISRMLNRDAERRPKDGAALRALIASLPSFVEGPRPVSVSGPSSTHETREQTLVSIVLVTFGPEGLSENETVDTDRVEAARRVLGRVGFGVEELADGSVLASVSSGVMAMDQARIAARGALYLREVWPEARIAVVTGRALMGRTTTRMGEAVDRAVKLLESRAADSTEGVWLDDVTAGLLDTRFTTQERAGAKLLLGERADEGSGRLLLGKPTPCVGREVELGELEGLLGRAIEDGEPQGVLVLGTPGTGKSRLYGEFARRLRATYPEALVLLGRGDPLTAGSPYGMMRDALRRHAGLDAGEGLERSRETIVHKLCARIEQRERNRVAEFLGELCGVSFLAEESPPLLAARNDAQVMEEQIAQAFSDWLSAECAARPVVLVLEDVHWGDALTVKLVRSVLRESGEKPFLVLCLGRPETRDLFPNLSSSRMTEMVLRPLGRRAIERLIKGVLGNAVGPETVERIVKLSEGNALFLEELIRAAAEGKTSEAPETVIAILQARLSRLSAPERRILRAASIVGETFWVGAVRKIAGAWSPGDDVDGWLGRLVEEELVERHKQSRFPREIEMRFRHALVRDAAYGLLTESDRRSGHLAAVHWLEAVGEADAMALAGHAKEGGDLGKAARFFADAGAASLGRNDLKEAVQRAEKGIECGAEGVLRGELLAIKAVAKYGLGVWPESAEAGLVALSMLPKGSYWWCRAAERLVQALPQVGDMASFMALAHDICRIEPPPEARSALVCALANLSYIFTVFFPAGPPEPSREALDRVLGHVPAEDLRAHATALMWLGIADLSTTRDPYPVQSRFEQAVKAFSAAQIHHELCMSNVLLGIAHRSLGDLDAGLEVTRGALALAERIEDGYQTANSRLHLGELLLERGDTEAFDEAEKLARTTLEAHVGAFYEASAWRVLAEVSLERADIARAAEYGERACTLVSNLGSVYAYQYAGSYMRALVAAGRAGEAGVIAKKYLESFEKWPSTGFFEVPFRLAVAETYFAAGDHESGKNALREALHQISIRAENIPEAAAKELYLAKRDNVRAFALAREWLGEAR